MLGELSVLKWSFGEVGLGRFSRLCTESGVFNESFGKVTLGAVSGVFIVELKFLLR